MRTKKFVSVLLVIGLAFSMVFISTSAHAATIISHPGGTIIDVDQGGDPFLLRHRLEWQESDVGYYIITIYWDCPDGRPHENFTLENASAYFDNGAAIENTVEFAGGFSPENENIWRYMLQVKNATGDSRNGQFTVDIWLRAAGEGGTPHYPTENHPIYYSGIDVAESSIVSETPSPITIRVYQLTGVAYPIDVADVYVQGDSQGEFWQPQLKFDISDVPSGATIDSVKLWMYRSDGWEWETNEMYVYRADDQTWDETITTGEFDAQTLENQETRAIGWSSNGWDYVDVENQFLSDYDAGNTYVTIRMEHVYDDSSSSDYIYNTGELYLGSDALQFFRIFYSRNHNGHDPYLEVEYTISLTGVTYPNDVADVYVQGDSQGEFWQPQLKFDISDVPSGATIDSVKLWMYRVEGLEWGPGEIYVYRADDQTWDETITTGEFDAQTLENQETRTGGWSSNGWDYVDVKNQFLSDYDASNTYVTIRMGHVYDDSSSSDYIYNTSELNLGSEPIEFFQIFYSRNHNGYDPYLEVEYTISIGS